MTAQIACEDTEMVYEDLGDEESWALVKVLLYTTLIRVFLVLINLLFL
jgi:hypothetical protein